MAARVALWPGDTDKLGQLVMLSTELGNRSGDEGELCGVEEHAQRGELRSLADEVQKTAIAHVDSSDAAFEHVLSGRAAQEVCALRVRSKVSSRYSWSSASGQASI